MKFKNELLSAMPFQNGFNANVYPKHWPVPKPEFSLSD